MSLSVCLVTRNEEENLPRVLRSVAGLADQVVVADTGSTDRTAAVAAELGARVEQFPWDDDFSAARNFALDMATGDWVLWLNPDEELLPSSHDAVRQATADPGTLAYHVHVQDQVRADRPDVVTQTVQLRLFRRDPELRFVGRLHPHFITPPEEVARRRGKQVGLAAVTVRRHGYLSKLTPDKLQWARRLLERELQDRPGQLHYLIEYGRTLLLLNDPRGHEVLADAAERLRGAGTAAPTSTAASLLEYLLTVSPAQSRTRVTREEARELALRWFPNSPPLLWRLAEQDFQAGNFRGAAGHLERLVAFGRTGAYDRSQGFDPSIVGAPAVMNLGVCYLRLGMLDPAEACFRQLLQAPEHAGAAAQNLRVVETLREGKRS
jgi:Glycosyl transferase family 2